jgi:hypothetical protein
MKKITSVLFSLVLVSAPSAAFAAGVGATAAVSTNLQVSVGGTAKLRADQEIDRRTSSLGQLMTRISGATHLSADEKANLNQNLTTVLSSLGALKAKIDADTDLASIKTDVQSITKGYRIYMLVLPQANIAVSADRINTIVSEMQTLGTKLEARINAANTTVLQSSYTDLEAKIADATAQANAAVTATGTLGPDDGNATVAASNTAALKAARAQIEAATADLVAAHADIMTILKGLNVSTGASATASTTAQ